MGVFTVAIGVGDPQGERFEDVEAPVDTGASYTAVPASLLRRLGVGVEGQRPFILADGRTVERDVGQTRVRIDGKTLMTLVVFAGEGTRPLLGMVTLEEFGLGIDPVKQAL
ncbi:MAG: retroviral-like aspartic protease family protein, partial [Dehalococcoidia bacterium]|nr:retroviral-like aspartic protease family protein [Dehalococcoidia bacterium]